MGRLPRSLPGQLLLTAALYAVAGRIALLMAIPPGYATAVWPAAGFALACVLVFGPRVWPAVVVGSFLVNVWTRDPSSGAWDAPSVVVAVAIGCGAAAQAALGGFLLRRSVEETTPFSGDRGVLRSLILAGPVSCLVSSSAGVTTLLAAGRIGPGEYAQNWFTWWVGDAIGAIVFTPLLLLWAPGLRRGGLARRLTVTLPFLVMFAAVTGLFLRAQGWWESWLILACGLLLTGLLGALLLVLTGGAARFEDLLHQRTAALARAEERARAIVETSHEAFVAINAEGRITQWNRAAEATFGWAAPEALGRVLAETIVPPRLRTAHREGLARFLATGEGPVVGRRIEMEGLHRDGREFPVELTITALRAGDSWVFNAFLHDISERKRAQRAIEGKSAELEAANRELEAFTYSVSHDLRAPLRAVEGFASILEKDFAPRLDGEGLRLLGVVRKNALRMSALIEDLLALSRLGRQALELVPLDMAALAREAAAEATAAAPGRPIRVEVGDLPSARGDRSLVLQVWQNLLANAVKFTCGRDPAVVEVTGRASDSEVVYSVRDNGAGFDMRYAEKLFGVFQRLHTQEEFEGTGVGLAIVQRIAHRHGGRVFAEGRPGEGATVGFALPRGGPA
ncbi:MAG: PAS domain S-box protein [Planctomycetales bacterium]|nr:PAS domain S-box protein [Planctomycetales bacterium]